MAKYNKIPDYKIFENILKGIEEIHSMEKITKKKNRMGGWTYETRVIFKGHECNRYSVYYAPALENVRNTDVIKANRSERDGVFWTTTVDWGLNRMNQSYSGPACEFMAWVRETWDLKNMSRAA